MPLHTAGQLWLAAHHVLLHTPDGPFGLTPLGFSILPAGALVLAGRRAALRYGAGVWSLWAVIGCYALAALLIAWSAASGSLHADPTDAVVYPCLIAVCGYGAGLLGARAARLHRWTSAAVRAGAGALAVLTAGGALLTALALSVHFPDVVRVGMQIGQGAAGATGLFLIDLALAPNLAVWALGFATGPGFAVGDGTSVGLTGVVHGPLPGLPVLAAVPPAGRPPSWAWAVLAVPLAAGVAALLLVWRSVRSPVERAAALSGPPPRWSGRSPAPPRCSPAVRWRPGRCRTSARCPGRSRSRWSPNSGRSPRWVLGSGTRSIAGADCSPDHAAVAATTRTIPVSRMDLVALVDLGIAQSPASPTCGAGRACSMCRTSLMCRACPTHPM
jgi:hypothetical protein